MGGWLVRRHNAGCAVLADWAEQECDCTVFREQVLPTANPDHAEARMDIVVNSPLVASALYVDLTVVSALSVEALAKGSALRDGTAAGLAARDKVSRYPNCRVWPFPVEDHGRVGEDSMEFIRTIAPQEPARRSAAIAQLYQSLACVLQRCAADSVIAATTGRSSAPAAAAPT